MPEIPSAGAWPLLLLLAVRLGAAASAPQPALTRGRGACMAAPDSPAPGAEATDAKGLAAPQSMSPGSTGLTGEELQDSFHLVVSSSEDLPTLWKAVSNYQSLRALGATDIQTWKEPCRRELYEVLERLAEQQQGAGGAGPHRFYLPNCHRSGFYHPKQVINEITHAKTWGAEASGKCGLCGRSIHVRLFETAVRQVRGRFLGTGQSLGHI
ncbi:insulin-like growth factor-binding protein 1 [Pteropus vampyrus]|uniref:Insulin-like growth factor-binding protein 1 n=1 Tax=Pteropus vampyrus TaxID=132908 RepID=A0A6P3RJN9_PTEVA|nr:insulin-like growth factor-binding protein 1 [Pteropus vampyrus]